MALDEQELAAHRAHRKQVLKERKAADKPVEPKAPNKLAVERNPEGLYYLRFTGGGTLPQELQGFFTSITRIKTLVTKRYGSEDILCQS